MDVEMSVLVESVPVETVTVLDLNKLDLNKIISDAAATLIADGIKAGWSGAKKFFKDLDATHAIRCGKAYEDYLRNTITSICQVKTLIFDSIPKYLYSFYEIPNLQYQDKLIDVSDVKDLLDLGNKLLITGTGGLGKSLLLKHLFLNTAQHGYYIPVLIELRKCNRLEEEKISLEDIIYQNLYDHGFQLEQNYYASSLEQGGYLILLDGFDEVRQEKAERVFDAIQEFTGRYSKNHVIVSSRPSDRLIGWSDFPELSLCDLTKEQAFQLIHKIDYDQEIKTAFLEALKDGMFETYESFASNPLLLTIMLLTFSKYAVLPENLNAFYDQAFSTLFYRHDRTKGYFTRDLHSHLSYDEFRMLFASFCFHSYFSEDFEFTEDQLRQYIQNARGIIKNQSFTNDDVIEDLTSSVCMLVREGYNYHFVHRSFQEYFAAWRTAQLTDEIQSGLLGTWISQSISCTSDKYMSMLFSLEGERVNKVVLCPGIKELKALYDKAGFSCDLLSTLYTCIAVRKEFRSGTSEQKSSYSTILPCANYYLCSIISIVCNLNGYSQPSHKIDPRQQEILRKISERLDALSVSSCSFKEAADIVGNENFLYSLRWFKDRIQFCFQIYDKYTRKVPSEKSTIKSILADIP